MEYKIITADSSKELANKVNALLTEGWQLQGGVSATTAFCIDYERGNAQDTYTVTEYAQAMTYNDPLLPLRRIVYGGSENKEL